MLHAFQKPISCWIYIPHHDIHGPDSNSGKNWLRVDIEVASHYTSKVTGNGIAGENWIVDSIALMILMGLRDEDSLNAGKGISCFLQRYAM